jgi:nucleoside-diphosphate-sugar epimerase
MTSHANVSVAKGNFLASIVRPLPHRVYNIGAGLLCSIREMAETIQGLLPEARVHVRSGILPGYSLISYFRGALDCSRAKRELGFAPKDHLRDGLRDLIGWYRENPNFRIFNGRAATTLE